MFFFKPAKLIIRLLPSNDNINRTYFSFLRKPINLYNDLATQIYKYMRKNNFQARLEKKQRSDV